ncbi:MAG: MFS transporter [Treponema sp.]|nr:MFS transporter [Treponema sp.]
MPPYITSYFVFAAVTPYLSLLIRGLGYSPAVVGMLLGVFEGAGIAGPFIFGYFADRWGRYKPGLILVYLLVIAGAAPLTFLTHPVLSAVFLAILAIGFRSSLPLLDAITTINLGKGGNYGKIRTAGSVSFIVFVLFLQLTPILRPNTSAHISLWIGVTSALALLSMSFIPAARAVTSASRHKASSPDGGYIRRGKGRLWSPLLVLGLVIMFLNRIAMTPVYTFFPLYLVESLHWDAVGLMFALGSASEVPVMYISHRLIRRFGPLPLLTFSAAAVGIRLGIYALFPFKGAVIAAQLLHSLCFGLFHPSAVAFITDCVPPERRALGITLYLSLGSGLPSLVGNCIGGFIVDFVGYQALFSVFTVFPFIALGLYLAVELTKRNMA